MQITIKPFNIKAVVCKSYFSKFRGMMFRCNNALPMLFIFDKEKKIPIHMLFVFFPLIVLWLDNKKRVVDRKILQPFQMYFPAKNAKFIVEIPLNSQYSKTKLMKIKKIRW